MFKRILFATDFSPHAETAKRIAMHLAQADDKQLWALTVLEPLREPLNEADEPPLASANTWEQELQQEEAGLQREEERLLKQDVKEMLASGVTVHMLVREGNPDTEILAAAREVEADLIVIGAHSDRNIWDVEMGNTAASVARHAPCPVLVVSHFAPHPRLSHERILLAADFSHHADQAFKVARALAKRTEGHLWLVSVLEPGEELRMLPGFAVEGAGKAAHALPNESRADVEARVRQKLETLAEEAREAGVETDVLTLHGHAAKEIRKAAVDIEADLIVMGSHSRYSVWDKLLGNTALNVAQHASCPVLLLHAAPQ